MIPSYGMIDTQINRDYKINTGILTAKVGVSNLLNNKVYQVYGGPRIGRLAYFSLTMNID
jgi:hypothetical protein